MLVIPCSKEKHFPNTFPVGKTKLVFFETFVAVCSDTDGISFDIDGNGQVDALSDGIMVVRYLFGDAFAGDALSDGAVANGATRTTHEDIRAYLDQIHGQGLLDIDGDNKQDALSDGIILVRYLFGNAFADEALTDGAVSAGATRTTHTAVREYLLGHTQA